LEGVNNEKDIPQLVGAGAPRSRWEKITLVSTPTFLSDAFSLPNTLPLVTNGRGLLTIEQAPVGSG
jgi:hypothetical protein